MPPGPGFIHHLDKMDLRFEINKLLEQRQQEFAESIFNDLMTYKDSKGEMIPLIVILFFFAGLMVGKSYEKPMIFVCIFCSGIILSIFLYKKAPKWQYKSIMKKCNGEQWKIDTVNTVLKIKNKGT